MRRLRRVRSAVGLLAGIVLLVGIGEWASRRYAEGLAFVVRAANMSGSIRWVADHYRTTRETERLITMPLPARPMRARMYWPDGPPRRTVLLVSGLHVAGIDEPRLVQLARELAERHVAVITPDIPQLSRFEITPAVTDAIEQSASWLAATPSLAPDGKVGLIGISFSGGLAMVAAGRPALASRVAFVVAMGSHDDLPRVLRYLCTGVDGTFRRPPHDYGVAIILLGVAHLMVPADQVEPLRDGIRRFLFASHLDRDDKPGAAREFAAVRALAAELPAPASALLTAVSDRDVGRLGPQLLPHVGAFGRDAALSPSESPKPTAPVFLLHGLDDNVIPPVESEALAADLQGHAPVRLLLSGLISHAEVDRPIHAKDVWQLAAFWGDVLAH